VVRVRDQQRIVGFLESIRYETLHRTRGFSNHLHSIRSLGRSDFVYVEGETGEKIFSEAQPFFLEDLSIPLVRPEHLTALKVFAMKNDPQMTFREMADIRAMRQKPSAQDRNLAGYLDFLEEIGAFDT